MPLRQFARLLAAAEQEPLDEDLDCPIDGEELPECLLYPGAEYAPAIVD